MRRAVSSSLLRTLCSRHAAASSRQLSVFSSWRERLANAFSAEVRPFTLLDGSTHPSKFQVLSDTAIIGGKSEGEVAVVEEAEGAFIRLTGVLRMEAAEGYKRSGFCNFRYNVKKPVDMGDYKALELEVRSDGRGYVLQMHIESMLPEDIYHARLDGCGSEWTKVRIPFSAFQAVFMGYPKEVQRQLDKFQIKAVGVLLADGVPGPFQLDVRGVRAIPAQE